MNVNVFRTQLLFIGLLSFSIINCQETIRVHKEDMPKNIILIIGDGMGLAQIQSGLTVNYGRLNLLSFRNIGFSKTQPAFGYITDSGAGATALSTGVKTYNGAIG